MISMNPPISTVKLIGEEIVAMLEENLERTFARDPYDQMGGYVKRSLGFNVTNNKCLSVMKNCNPGAITLRHLLPNKASRAITVAIANITQSEASRR
jgi:hypothetical protein